MRPWLRHSQLKAKHPAEEGEYGQGLHGVPLQHEKLASETCEMLKSRDLCKPRVSSEELLGADCVSAWPGPSPRKSCQEA